MKTRMLSLFALLGWLAIGAPANAAYSCSVSSPGISTTTELAVRAVVQSSVTITCTKAAGDAATMAYGLAADNGQNAQGQNNRASFGSSTVRYDLYKDSNCASNWKSAGGNIISGSLIFQTATSGSWDIAYWACIPAASPLPPAGTYTDTVTMTLSYGPNPQSSAVNSFPVSIATTWNCVLSSPPGDVAFGTYLAFGGPLAASTNFGITCSQFLPYTISLSASGGTIAGLNYTLSLSTASSVGTGALQTHVINGAMAGGQAGTCGTATCNGTDSRTLTITY